MPAYVIIEARVKDEEKFHQYLTAFFDILSEYGGRYLVRGSRVRCMDEGASPERRQPGWMSILEFPSEVDLRRCLTSPAYRSIRPVRDEGADTRAMVLEGFKPEML